jgi:hypothetical protein
MGHAYGGMELKKITKYIVVGPNVGGIKLAYERVPLLASVLTALNRRILSPYLIPYSDNITCLRSNILCIYTVSSLNHALHSQEFRRRYVKTSA